MTTVTVTYYATYTAYNGFNILPQLIETKDLIKFNVLTLNGKAVRNKGMALFPCKINGRIVSYNHINLFIRLASYEYHDNNSYW